MELPPRARRIHPIGLDGHVPTGTTSACAENTYAGLHPYPYRRNYLRVRGEYLDGWREWGMGDELPPRARRIPRRGLVLHDEIGTTSACAENTLRVFQARRARVNYLRVRGEYAVSAPPTPVAMELPPRARRIHYYNTVLCMSSGTTSACAENTGA